jgi:hypothetical protein
MANRIQLLRPDDLLYLEIEPVNLALKASSDGTQTLVRQMAGQPSYLVVHFPPQAIMEEAFLENPPPGFDNNKINGGDAYSKNAPAETATPLTSAESRLSGPSRLVFRLPDARDFSLPFTVAALLDWDKYQLVVTPIAGLGVNPAAAEINQSGEIRPPELLETSIELPYRLLISPNGQAGWGHSLTPVTHAGLTEVWHTRLLQPKADGTQTTLSAAHQAPLRAVWSPDFQFEPRTIIDIISDKPPVPVPKLSDNQPFRSSMNGYDRFSIVLNTSAFKGYVDENSASYRPRPFFAEQLMLSPVGGWLRSRGNWELPYYLSRPLFFQTVAPKPVQVVRPTPGFSLLTDRVRTYFPADPARITPELSALLIRPGVRAVNPTTALSEWVHRATMGRDHYVRIVYEGYLYPFGHRAALIKVTERKIKKLPGNRLYAVLMQRMFIVVREPVKDYAAIGQRTVAGLGTRLDRHLPFRNIRLTTLVTPDIVAPGTPGVDIGDFAIWVKVNENGQVQPFRFHATAEEYSGRTVDFNAAMIFVSADKTATVSGTVYKAYAAASSAERFCPANNQTVTYVNDPGVAMPDNTRFETEQLEFHAREMLEPGTVANYAGYVPFLLSAKINLPALEKLLGTPKPVRIRLADDYLKSGLTNSGKVFAELVKEAPLLPGGNLPQFAAEVIGAAFSASQAGGLSTPSFEVSCLSESLGPLGGKISDAQQSNFDPASFFPTTLGPKLFGEFDLADLIIGGLGSLGKNAPNIIREPDGVSMKWEPALKNYDLLVLKIVLDEAKALIEARIKQLPPGPGVESVFKGKIDNFELEFLEVVALHFKSFAFESLNGAKPSINVQLQDDDPLQFKGALKFVNELRNIIPKGLFGDGASLELISNGIRAGFSFAVPPVAVGVFALKDIVLSAYLTLPFTDGKPLFDFGISERHKPFVLTVAFFGGGGFFHLQVDTKGVRQLEAALEFGANASIDLGVASGGVHFMAGIYFGMKRADSGVTSSELTGYLRCGGELSVLGLISVSLEFMLSFTYYVNEDKCKGRATLVVTVEILFFSASVELTVEKGFGGASGDPVLREVMPEAAIWNEYAASFA